MPKIKRVSDLRKNEDVKERVNNTRSMKIPGGTSHHDSITREIKIKTEEASEIDILQDNIEDRNSYKLHTASEIKTDSNSFSPVTMEIPIKVENVCYDNEDVIEDKMLNSNSNSEKDLYFSTTVGMSMQIKDEVHSTFENNSDWNPVNIENVSDSEFERTPADYTPANSLEVEQTNKSVSNKELFKRCQICHKKFSKNSSLQRHERIHTGEKPYQCEFCAKSFNQISTLQSHRRIHTGEKPYKCNDCENSFNQLSHLRTHMRTHEGSKPYICKRCGMAFSDSAEYHVHKQTHQSVVVQFQCSGCEKTFDKKCYLQVHERIHTGERPCVCSYCDKAFYKKSNLLRHELTHTKQTPYECDICGKAYGDVSNLTRHKRLHVAP